MLELPASLLSAVSMGVVRVYHMRVLLCVTMCCESKLLSGPSERYRREASQANPFVP